MGPEEEANRLKIKSWSKENSRLFEAIYGCCISVFSKRFYHKSTSQIVLRNAIIRKSILFSFENARQTCNAVCKINWAGPGFHFWFSFFRSVDLIKVKIRCLNARTLNVSYMWAWSLLIYLVHFGQIMCSRLCHERRNSVKETIKLRFSASFPGVVYLRLV